MSRDVLRDVTVLLGPSSFGDADPAARRLLTDAGLRLVDNPFKRKLTRAEVRALLTPDVRGLIAGLEPLDGEILAGSSLRVVSRVGSGVSNVDLAAARTLGIAVRSTPDAPVNAVAELTLGAMLSLMRGLPEMNQALHGGAWTKILGGQLEGKAVAVIGFGRIGRRVAQLVRAFGARVMAVDPMIKTPAVEGVPVRSLDEALRESDIVTLHVSGEKVLLDSAAFARLKRGAYICNAARGGVIDEIALKHALDAGVVSGAWLDCFVEEPYTGPLREYRQVLLTPHVGSYTRECRVTMEMEAAVNLLEELKRG